VYRYSEVKEGYLIYIKGKKRQSQYGADEYGKIGRRYVVKEIEQLLFALQGNSLKMGALESLLSSSLNRNQLKYLTGKLIEDVIIQKNGEKSGTVYSIGIHYSHLRGNDLINKIIYKLREKYNSPGK